MTLPALLLLLQRELAGKEIAPSWGAWAGLISLLPLGFLVFDRIWGRGRHEQRMESDLKQLCKDFEDFKREEFTELKDTVGIMDEHLSSLSSNVQTLTLEWKGVDGKNGWKSIVRALKHDVTEIQKRNLQIDAVSQYEQDQLRKHGKKPERLRDKLSEDADDN